MQGSLGGGVSAASESEVMWLNQEPIAATALVSPFFPCPRAWERVLVVPAVSHGRQRKIWKRVAGSPLGARDGRYLGALAELESQGAGSRKRARRENHIPIWGEGSWNAGVDLPRNGEEDLVTARELVSTAEAGEKPALPAASASKHATFPEDKLRWVPRKRHNTRWPIQPKTTEPRMIAAFQPLVEFEVPKTAAPVDTARQVGGQQMEKRSTRRLSRRLSLFPGDQSPRKLSAVRLSPVKMSALVLSPLKKPPVTLSPQKVAESPYRSFSVNATPNKVILKSPKPSSPTESPLKSSPLPAVRSSLGASPSVARPSPASPSVEACPLVFDQPILESVAEPEYETRRRRSLQNARHSDRRRSSGVARLARFDETVEAPSRRHSFSSARRISTDAKSRRITLDVSSFSSIDVVDFRRSLGTDSNDGSLLQDGEAGVADATYSVVKVDAGTTLDIFSPQRKAISSTLSPASSRKNGSPSPLRDAPPATHGTPAREAPVDQAAMSLSPSAPEEDDANSDIDEDYPPSQTEFEEAGIDPEPANPEGLSTIYEESSDMDQTTDDGVAAKSISQPCAEVVGNATIHSEEMLSTSSEQGDAAEMLEVTRLTGSSAVARRAPSVASGGQPAPEIPTHRAVMAADVLSNPDLPKAIPRESSGLDVESSTPSPLNGSGQGAASPSPSQDSVVTPDDDFCVTTTTDMLVKVGASDLPTATFDSMAADNDQHELPLLSKSLEAPGTPQATATALVPGAVKSAGDSPSSESSGFTPINGRQISPPQGPSVFDAETQNNEVDSSDEQEVDDDDDDEMMTAEDEMTEAMDEDEMTLTVVGPHIENDTITLQASHDDSETELLRKFVTRVAADKNAKAAAAAAALTKKSTRPKRRSGSTGSTTSTGSPVAKSDTPHRRTPLGERSANSPSPVKKRKLEDEDELVKPDMEVLDVCEESTDAPKSKRRRKRADPVLDAAPEGVSLEECQSYFTSSEVGPRRSTRSRNSRVALKPAAPSANSIALSTIPVRLPGMAGMADDTMEAHLAALKSRSEEKDLAAVTRVNTRKNKGNSVYPKVVLARQSEDPSWRMKELKGVFDAKESRAAEAKGITIADGRKSRKAKGVRWAEELVRFQGDEKPSAFKSLASSLLADIMMEAPAQEVDELAPQPELKVEEPAKPEPRENPVATPVKRALPRRTRSSRLQAPAPVAKIPEKTTPPSTQPLRRTALPKASVSIIAPAATTPNASSSAAKVGMATRRSKIAKLGMGVNGTPAPKRKGRAAL
ncbi:hypothetical protein OQA88_8367 [Cercophora sp. LCS_1]